MRNREEKKCKKGQETTIGKIIYGFLLFMPLLAIFVTCGYAIFNKNAYQSYYGETINESQKIQIDDFDDIQLSKKYTILNETYLTYQQTGRINLFVNNVENNTDNRDLSNVNKISLYSNVYNNENHVYIVFYNDNTQITNYDFLTYTVNVSFYLDSFNYENNTSYYLPLIYRVDYNNYSFVSDVFYYSVDKVEQSNLFNWSKNSIIYTGSYNTCQQLSITNTFIPLLLSYWLIISILYFLYDIALMLVWIVHRKIHELQESI